MVKGFQKPAKTVHELRLPHPGIINTEDFNAQFELHCYQPSPDLQPFVTHIWTQRSRPPDASRKAPVEIVSGPNIYLFFTPESAFIQGVTKHEFAYDPLAANVIAGVKFQPGGFYPFLRHSVSDLNTTAFPVMSVFPTADTAFREKLLAQSDETIVNMIEDLLRSRHPEHSKNLSLIAEIVSTLATNTSLRTVGATAQAFNMSERSLQLLFQTYVGIGVKWIITRRRLLEAISRIQSRPDTTWIEVAAELGYSSQSHFTREFKQAIGRPPSQYLKRL